jgi:putative serine protease PepD
MKQRYRTAAIATAAALAAGAGTGVVVASQDGSGSAASAPRTVIKEVSPAASTSASGSMTAAQIYQADAPGIVEIRVREQASSGQGLDPFGGGGQQTTEAQGTGFEIDSKGDIVTNAHVVDGASSITVKTEEGKSYTATLVGKDDTTDVAVIHIDAAAGDLHPLTFGDSSEMQVGDPVVAIGDPFGLTDSLSTGVVSALNRTITSPDNHPINNAIQTDAAINHGNSGGPLLNDQGQVIGITSQIYADDSTSGNVGIGFAVPSSTVERITSELITSGKATHPFLGIYLEQANGGAKIARVTSGSPAADAGLKAGEVITAIDGHSVSGPDAVIAAVSSHKPGDQITLTVGNGSSTSDVTATLGSTS